MKCGDEVFMDTNAMIEAHRVKAWAALAKAFQVWTVDECLVEAATGDRLRQGYVPVDVETVRETLRIAEVPTGKQAQVATALPVGLNLDPGERDLLAAALAHPRVWFICSPDKAAMRAGYALGVLDQFVSLEQLGKVVGLRPAWRQPFTEKWLTGFKSNLILGIL